MRILDEAEQPAVRRTKDALVSLYSYATREARLACGASALFPGLTRPAARHTPRGLLAGGTKCPISSRRQINTSVAEDKEDCKCRQADRRLQVQIGDCKCRQADRRLQLDYSPPTLANRVRFPAGLLPDFRVLKSCRRMPPVGGFSRGSPVHAWRCSILTSITPVG
ncbi:hypothetical protein PR048_032886 [Dryococelus australis]|uniref:Uncharacterized protein n=1 Tax=Dryococelus australis TaxID=614101 RepID=A0ABQ9G3H9_9NEOP|nr:hypothetical protein PR048_032886 [Dryococelus australis]